MKYLTYFFTLILVLSLNSNSFSRTRGWQFGDIIWEILVPNNPGTTVQDKQIKSLKQIPDVNGDGINDVIVATGNYWTLCYSGLNGNLLWQYSTHFGSINTGSVEWEDAMEIADVDNNGIYDVVIGCGGGNEMVYALNGSNGTVLWSYGNSTTTNDGDIESISIKYDFNNDGIKDVIVSASGVTNGGRHAAICLSAVNGQQIFFSTMSQPFTDDAIAIETGAAIGVNNNGAPYGVIGLNFAGSIVWNYTATGNIWSLKEIPDINNNGNKDILGLCGFNSTIFAISGNSGAQIWASNLGSSNNGKICLLDDANANGSIDFLPSAPQVACRVDSKTGTIIWQTPLGSSYLRGVDNLDDITGDGIDDIVIATQLQPRLIVLNGSNGGILFDYSFGATLTQRGDRAAVLKDIDTNGINEFLGGNREGRVICFYGGDGTITNIEPVTHPVSFNLYQNFPNPFNPSTSIKFDIPQNTFAALKVFNILGKEVAVLLNGEINAGAHEFSFDATGLSSGVYFYTLETNDFKETKRMLLTK